MAGRRGDGVGASEGGRGRGLSVVVGVLIGIVRLCDGGVIGSVIGSLIGSLIGAGVTEIVVS